MIKKVPTMAMAVILMSGCSKFGSIPILGLNDKGEEVVNYLRKSYFKKELSKYLVGLDQEVIPALDSAPPRRGWYFDSISFGLGFEAKVNTGVLSLRGRIGLSTDFRKKQ